MLCRMWRRTGPSCNLRSQLAGAYALGGGAPVRRCGDHQFIRILGQDPTSDQPVAVVAVLAWLLASASSRPTSRRVAPAPSASQQCLGPFRTPSLPHAATSRHRRGWIRRRWSMSPLNSEMIGSIFASRGSFMYPRWWRRGQGVMRKPFVSNRLRRLVRLAQ